MPSFIPDGYTDSFYLAPNPGLHDGLRGRRRRAVRWEIQEARHEAGALKPREAEARWAKFIREHLVDWSLVDPEGKSVPLSEENILRLEPDLFDNLLGLLSSLRASDPDPNKLAVPSVPPADPEGADTKNS